MIFKDLAAISGAMTTVIDTVSKARHPEKAHRPDNDIQRKPDWIRVKAPVSREYVATREVVRANNLKTVCEEAACPNIGECWTKRHATMMIMGDTCTRACAFCNVKTGLPAPLDTDEPANVANGVKTLGLAHVVITSVDRDDLPDGGAEHFARVINAIHATDEQHRWLLLGGILFAEHDDFDRSSASRSGDAFDARPRSSFTVG